MIKINYLKIRGYRSLKDLEIKAIKKANIFHGENNTGKSNIIQFLHILFQNKIQITGIELDSQLDGERPTRSTPFWKGNITDYRDNTFMGTNNDVEFIIRMEVNPAYFESLKDNKLYKVVYEQGHDIRFCMEGAFRSVDEENNIGEIILNSVTVNKKSFYKNSSGIIEHMDGFKTDEDDHLKQDFVEKILTKFTNIVCLIPATRYLRSESVGEEVKKLNTENFKKWLHSISLSRGKYGIYKKILNWFNDGSLNLGEIGFSKVDDVLEIMVEDESAYRMPISCKGTGVHQMLILMAYIADSGVPIICLEEPELNLSYSNQDLIMTKLRLLLSSNAGPSQIFVTSHSDHIGSRADFQRYFVKINQDTHSTDIETYTQSIRRRFFPHSSKWRNT